MWIFWEETCHSYVRKLPEQPSDLMLREVEWNPVLNIGETHSKFSKLYRPFVLTP
jgi:hypothetical protein